MWFGIADFILTSLKFLNCFTGDGPYKLNQILSERTQKSLERIQTAFFLFI